MVAQDGAGDASMLLVAAEPKRSELLALPACDRASARPTCLRAAGVQSKMHDVMAGRADRHEKTQTCDPHDMHAA